MLKKSRCFLALQKFSCLGVLVMNEYSYSIVTGVWHGGNRHFGDGGHT